MTRVDSRAAIMPSCVCLRRKGNWKDGGEVMIKRKILKCGYSARGALLLLLRTDPNLDLQSVEEVYYPYVRLRYMITVGKGKKIARLNKISDCVIDRVSGSTYESRDEANFEEVEFSEDQALAIQISMSECYKIGHGFTLKQYIGKARLMFTPKMRIIEEDVFYKKFYVAGCLDDKGQSYYILVDGVDGGLSVLDHGTQAEGLLPSEKTSGPQGVFE